jgi:photosystem II stability/assembly factor-like uncharacterized protein
MEARKLRAAVLIALSLTIAGVVGAIYASPHLLPSPAYLVAPTPTPVQTTQGELVTFDFLTPTAGWAAASAAGTTSVLIFRTSDGGKSWVWTAEIGGLSGTEVNEFHFFDRATGYIAIGAIAPNAGLNVFQTRDGGAHWSSLQSPDPLVRRMTFSDEMDGWATAGDQGSHLFSTHDGGQSWTRLPDLPPLRTAVFRSPTEGWLTGDASTGPAEVLTSSDGGVTWQPHVLPQPPSGMFTGPSLDPAAGPPAGFTVITLLPGSGVLVYEEPSCQSNTPCPTFGPAEFASFDLGATWRYVPPAPGGDYTTIAFQDAHSWWVIQANNLWKTADAGATWRLVSSAVMYDHLSPRILDAQHAWAQIVFTADTAGRGRSFSASELDMSSDGGVHWTQVSVPVAG